MGERTERKVVTVLFCDLVGFTATFDHADPEDVQDALEIYHLRVLREIERFGGTAEKFIGDAVMAVFGAPVAHEDDAERAVLSALRIPPAIDELNAANERLDLAVRVGIETGEAVVTVGGDPSLHGLALGDVVNTASRIQGVAPSGGVVVGERTYRIAKDAFDFEELAPVTVKGKAAALNVWLARSARSRFGADMHLRPSTPLVDRENELELLKRTFSRAVQESSFQLVSVMGEPGVGKSRLIHEFFRYLDDLPDRASWRQGRCLPYGEGVTFWALGQIVKAQAGILESDGQKEATEKLVTSVGTLVAEPSEQEWVRARLAPLIGLPEPQVEGIEREESFSAWRRFLEAIAVKNPLVVVMEDIHWADPALLDFASYMAEWSAGVPIMLLCTARPELFERAPSWGGGKRNSSTVSLSPLSDRDSQLLISALLPSATSEERDRLVERSGGNPLFAEEFAHMVLESSDRPIPGSVETPDSITAIIAARLDSLPIDQKALLQDASVVGKDFWPGALVAVGSAPPADVTTMLHELTRSELIRPSKVSSIRDEAEYSFAHALIRDVAYGQIPRGPRADKHVACARWIEQMTGERISEYAELLAHHYGQALDLAKATGKADPAALEATRSYWVMAGGRAMNLDVASAEACFDRVLDSLASADPQRPSLLAMKAEASFNAGRYQESQKIYEEALAGFGEQGDSAGVGACLVWLASVLWEQGETVASRARMSEAVDALEREPPGEELAECYCTVASQRLLIGRFEEAVEWSKRSLALATTLDADRLRPRALGYMGMARSYLGEPGGLDDLREALKITERLGLSRENARVLLILAEVQWGSEGPATALEAANRGADLAGRRGLSDMLIGCHTTSMGPMFDLGRWDELMELVDDVLKRTRQVGGGYATVMTLPWKQQVLLVRGEVGSAEEIANDVVEMARSIRDPQVLVPAFVASALVFEEVGRGDDAFGLVDDLDNASGVRLDWYREQWLADIARVCVATGHPDAASRFIAASAPLNRRHRLSMLTAQAVTAEAIGDTREAAEAYDEAAKGWSEYGHILETGNALLGAGRCLRGADSAAGQARLQRARSTFEGLGASMKVREVDSIT